MTPPSGGVTIGARVSALAKARGLSKSELARRLKTSYRMVHKWTSGAQLPERESLLKLAGVLGVTIEELLGVAAGQDPPFEAWGEFLASDQGVTITPDERRALQVIPWPPGQEPTITGYLMMLAALRSGTRPRT